MALRRIVLVVLLALGLLSLSPARALGAGDDTVVAFGDASFLGSTSDVALASAIVGLAARRDGAGYWLVARDGGIFAFGRAAFLGSTGGMMLNQPIVGMAATPTGRGYWLVASDGGVFTFGDAAFYGSSGAIRLARPIVGMATTPTGRGYWLVASDGGVFNYGDAAFFGSAASFRPARPVVALAPTWDGTGYLIAAADGSVYTFGTATYHGNAPGHEPITAAAASPIGTGYYLLGQDGGVYALGGATFAGSAVGQVPAGRVALGLAPTASGNGYLVATGTPVLVAGATGSPVRHLQSRLEALGYWVPVDGRFSILTTQALYALQKSAGLPRSGHFDAATQRALDSGFRPTPRSTEGYAAEIDKTRQILMLVSNGRVVWTFNTSTGNGARYRSGRGYAIAHTPEGLFRIYTQINGPRVSELGQLWRPKYFTGGYAIHGSPSIPPFPASHGCVRLSNAAANFLWDAGALPLGTPVHVYR